jgi:hypothetical protein
MKFLIPCRMLYQMRNATIAHRVTKIEIPHQGDSQHRGYCNVAPMEAAPHSLRALTRLEFVGPAPDRFLVLHRSTVREHRAHIDECILQDAACLFSR